MSNVSKDDEAEEAKRLALLPKADQIAFLDMLRKLARDPTVPDAERKANRRRATALAKHLKLK
jgi:hypothetical protein